MASDRTALVKAFDESRTGVRGLVESGISSVPDLFVHPDPYASAPLAPPGVSIPVVDLSLPAPIAAAAAAEAARSWGFFHLINHHRALAIPDDYPARALAAVRAFNELPAADRAAHYGRRRRRLLLQHRPVPLPRRELARLHPGGARVRPAARPVPDAARLPRRRPGVGRARHRRVARRAGAPLRGARARAAGAGGDVMPGGEDHFLSLLPACPEPRRTVGIVPHTDAGVITVLAQDGVGGLQVKHTDDEGRSLWVDVKSVPGALVINVGDLLQIMSNNKYNSVEHRVVMNAQDEARVSIALFFTPGKRGLSFVWTIARAGFFGRPTKVQEFYHV